MIQPKDTYRQNIIAGYCIIFYVLMVYKWFNGMFLYQMQPHFFYTRDDVFSWLLMATALPTWLLNNKNGWMLFDALFYTAPLLFYVVYKKLNGCTKLAAIALLLINWLYVQCYVLYPTTSIEGHIAWLLFPIVFIPKQEKTFGLLFSGLRYFFIFFFVSAGIWKLVQGGIYYPQEMSNILLLQHKELLIITPQHWYADFIMWLVAKPTVSYCLYVVAALLELSFVIGFFTKKYDRYFILVFVVFLLCDHFIMRIPYYEVLPLVLTLMFSKNRNSLEGSNT